MTPALFGLGVVNSRVSVSNHVTIAAGPKQQHGIVILVSRGRLRLRIMKRTRKDHSGAPKNKLPPVPKLELILYHWTPTTNRKNINKEGLCPNRRSLQTHAQWRPPYVCFSDDPYLGWVLSGNMWPEINSWDLWMCHFESQTSFDHYEIITDTFVESGRSFIKEYRVYARVYKRDLIYLATRTH